MSEQLGWDLLKPESQNDTTLIASTEILAVPRVPEKKPQAKIPPTTEEPHVYSVSDLNRLVKNTVETACPFIWLRAEISNFKSHSSGHFYFALKDDKSQINAVMFKGFNSRLKFSPEDGMEVLVRGRITVYEPRGTYQIFCEVMEPVGIGALQKAFEQLKVKLEQEGLFDQKKKRALPAFPSRIVLVTSPTGAAIRDMLNILYRRFKCAEITLVSTTVQGDSAPREIVAAIELANKVRPAFDVMIVGRGGGSIEDLWAFNSEAVARAIAKSEIPTVSAVGHEIDFTIADFVADLRAPTPSAAAELVVSNAADVSNYLTEFQQRLKSIVSMVLKRDRKNLEAVSNRLIDPKRRIQDAIFRCDELVQRMEVGIYQRIHNQRLELHLLDEKLGTPKERISKLQKRLELLMTQANHYVSRALDKKKAKFQNLSSVLESVSPLKVVERGYSIVTFKGNILKNPESVALFDVVEIQLAQGKLTAKVESISK